MKQLFGNYLGLCINNNDPQKRGRVQIFIPHIMPALYENWNKEGTDINITCVGDNIPQGLSTDIIDELRKILPWAESASPILGSSSPGTLTSSVIQAVAAAATGGLTTLASAAYNEGKKLFEQSPVAAPPAASQDQQATFNSASKYGKVTPEMFARTRSNTGLCATGVRQMIGGMTNNSYFSQGIGAGGSPNAGSLSSGNRYLQNSGYYNEPTSVPAGYTPQKGDVISGTSAGAGHVQVYDGKNWVSDFTQKGVLTNYGNLTLHRMNDKGIAAMGGTDNVQGQTVAKEEQSPSGTIAAVSPLQSETPIKTDPEHPSYGNVANPEIQTGSTPATPPGSPTNGITPKLTAYSPAAPGSALYKMEGGSESSKVGPDGTAQVRTLQDVATGNSGYVTLAGDAKTAGQKYVIPSVTFTNAAGQTQTLKNVPAVVHDTGGAFKGAGTSHFDVAVDKGMTNSQMANQDFTKGGLELQPANDAAFAAAQGQSTATQVTPKMVNKTDPHGPTAVVDMNNMAKGVFSYPAPGALLWVFFQDGNPLFPVYFAANYGAAEWQSAYRYGSPGPSYQPEGTAENPATSQGGIMNLNGVGGLRWENTDHPTDHTQSQKSISLFGEDGSNMFMGKGYHQIFSKYDRRDQVEGDRFNTTLGYKEEWVQGDDSKTTMGDVIIRIGNVSKPAVDAVTRIQEIIKEIHKPLTESSK
jgi:hypothetical protein